MRAKNLDVLIIGDPGNINWICGFDAWSFYTPQMMVIDLNNDPIWFGREMDAGAAKFTTYLNLRKYSKLSRGIWFNGPTLILLNF